MEEIGGQHRSRRPRGHLLAECQRYLVRAAQVEVIADEALEEGPPGRRAVKHPGIGDLELAERQVVDIPGAQIVLGEREGRRRCQRQKKPVTVPGPSRSHSRCSSAGSSHEANPLSKAV
jgi:hypothetical protein